MAGSEDDNPPPPSQTPTQQTPHTVSTIKLHILKKGEYDIWAMKMEHYLAHTDYPIWEVIQRGNGPVRHQNTEVTSCSKECKESYAKLKKLYDEQREQLGDASIEIHAYTQALKKGPDAAKDKARLGYAKRMHAVPPPMTGIYIPSGR
ncbi:hypothetical protein Tco_0418245 [Tanacetum coccineum]